MNYFNHASIDNTDIIITIYSLSNVSLKHACFTSDGCCYGVRVLVLNDIQYLVLLGPVMTQSHFDINPLCMML